MNKKQNLIPQNLFLMLSPHTSQCLTETGKSTSARITSNGSKKREESLPLQKKGKDLQSLNVKERFKGKNEA